MSPYSVRMRENSGKMRTRITPNTDSFYAVLSLQLCQKKLQVNWILIGYSAIILIADIFGNVFFIYLAKQFNIMYHSTLNLLLRNAVKWSEYGLFLRPVKPAALSKKLQVNWILIIHFNKS